MLEKVRGRGRAADLVAAEVLLRAGALLGLLFALALLLGSNGFGVLTGDVPLVGATGNAVMSERSEIAGTEGLATVQAVNDRLGPLERRSDAASTGGPVRNWAEASGPVEVTVGLWNPTTAQRWAWTAVRAVPALAVAASLWLLAGMAASARKGDPFTRANVLRLEVLIGLVAVAGVVGEWGATFVRRWLLDSSDLGSLVPTDFSVSFGFLGVIAVLAVLTTVWRRGVAMREDLDGLV